MLQHLNNRGRFAGIVCRVAASSNKGIHSDPKSLVAFGSGDTRRYTVEKQ